MAQAQEDIELEFEDKLEKVSVLFNRSLVDYMQRQLLCNGVNTVVTWVL